jgi:hypothetical protein
MFKLFSQIPTGEDHIVDICDYLEVKSILSTAHECSINDLVKQFLQPSDEDYDNGVEDYSDYVREKVELVSQECQRRSLSCGNRYPFVLEYSGEVLRFEGLSNLNGLLYVYLLFATRLDMRPGKAGILNKVDGTKLMELISAEISKSYFGPKSKVHIVGTANQGGFHEKVNTLCDLLGEGIQFKNHNEGPVGENDGGLDIVVWIDFSDKRPSKFIAFGQCKTGTNWEDHITELNPEVFCRLWFSRQPALIPLRAFFIADIVHLERWYKTVTPAGLFFDRLRIVDHLPDILPVDLNGDIQSWTNEAIRVTGQNLN